MKKYEDLKFETRVYLIDLHDVVNGYHLSLSDQEFKDLAEEQGTVYSLEGFQTSFNKEGFLSGDTISSEHSVIRFITTLI